MKICGYFQYIFENFGPIKKNIDNFALLL